MEEKEIWKDVVGYEGSYQVSSMGRVKTIKFGRDKIIGTGKDCRGYTHVTLFKNNKRLTRNIHRLVAIAFIPNPNNYEQIDHIDGNPQNNKVENLRWCTAKQNHNFEKAIENKIRIHVKLEGKKICQFSKLGIKIRTWDSISSAARTLGIARKGIRDCCRNKQKSAFGYIWKYKNNESC